MGSAAPVSPTTEKARKRKTQNKLGVNGLSAHP
jgi:hypothetical protein